MKQVILIKGRKRVGKDTVADMLHKYLQDAGHDVSRASFAQPMKDIIADTFDISLEELDLCKNKPEDAKICLINMKHSAIMELSDFRKVLQRFGTEAMKKHFGDDVWSELLYNNLKSDVTIVSDWRFKSELAYLQSKQDVMITTISVFSGEPLPNETHISEIDLDGVDTKFTVHNIKNELTSTSEQVEAIADSIYKQTRIEVC